MACLAGTEKGEKEKSRFSCQVQRSLESAKGGFVPPCRGVARRAPGGTRLPRPDQNVMPAGAGRDGIVPLAELDRDACGRREGRDRTPGTVKVRKLLVPNLESALESALRAG